MGTSTTPSTSHVTAAESSKISTTSRSLKTTSTVTTVDPKISVGGETTLMDGTSKSSSTKGQSKEVTEVIFYETAIEITEYSKAFTSTVYTSKDTINQNTDTQTYATTSQTVSVYTK